MRKYLAPTGSLRIFTVSGCRSGKNSNEKIKVMKKEKNDIQTIKEVLMNSEVKFTVRGRENTYKTRILNSERGTSAIYLDEMFGQGMNVSKFGPTCVTLYTFDMFSSKTTAKIRYADVELISTVKK